MSMQNEGTQTILNTKEGNVHYNSDKLWYQWTSIKYPDQKKEFCEQSYDGKTWIKLTKSSEIEDKLFLRSVVDVSKMPYDPRLETPLLFLFGYLPQFNHRTYVYIPELLQNNAPSIETLNEDDLIVDVLTIKDDTYTLSISIRRDIHVPTKLELSGAEKVSIFYNDYIATATQQWHPQNYTIEMKPPTQGPTQILTTNLSEVVLNQSFKDSDFSLKTQISNGNRVDMDDDPQAEYIWMDGDIVQKTDELMLALAQQEQKSAQDPKGVRFWLIWGGLLLILIGGSIRLYRRFLMPK